MPRFPQDDKLSGMDYGNQDPVVVYEEIFPGDTNPYGTAFGGKILALMDRAAGLAASRFAKRHFVTASLDAMDFRSPVRQGQIAEVTARVVYTSSHTVGVEVSVAAVDGTEWQPRCCARGLFFMVAIGEHGSLQTVPALDFDSLDESGRRSGQEAAEVHRRMLARRSDRLSQADE